MQLRMAPPAPQDELTRLRVLRDSDILDSGREASFDRIAERAAAAADCPIALVTFVDVHRQWFKAVVGLEAEQTAREDAFCAWAILDRSVFLVPDALDDPRFRTNPLVTGEPHIRAYAGAPILSLAGARLGTVCAIDRRPRTFDPGVVEALADLAGDVSVLLAERFALRAVRFAGAA